MARGKRYQPEQVVNLLRQIEVAVANGKTTAQAYKEAEIVEQTYGPSSLILIPSCESGKRPGG
jgi:hypothetical protein